MTPMDVLCALLLGSSALILLTTLRRWPQITKGWRIAGLAAGTALSLAILAITTWWPDAGSWRPSPPPEQLQARMTLEEATTAAETLSRSSDSMPFGNDGAINIPERIPDPSTASSRWRVQVPVLVEPDDSVIPHGAREMCLEITPSGTRLYPTDIPLGALKGGCADPTQYIDQNTAGGRTDTWWRLDPAGWTKTSPGTPQPVDGPSW